MPYPPSRLASVSPTGPAPRMSTSVSKSVEVIVCPRGGGGSATEQEVEVDLVEGLGVLVLRPVAAVVHHRELRVRDQRGDSLRLVHRTRWVLGGPQHQRRSRDGGQVVVGEHVALAGLEVLQ